MASVLAFLGASDGPTDGTTRVASQLFGEPETSLIYRLRAGDEDAFRRIYTMLRPRLVSVARNYVSATIAEDIAQDVLALVWERRAEWPVERGLTTYLYAAVRNRTRDHARHVGVVGRIADRSVGDAVPGAGEPPVAPDAAVEQTELGRAFVTALARLSEGARTALTLRWVHQLGYPEIAEIMGISEPAARKQVSRAREILLSELSRYID